MKNKYNILLVSTPICGHNFITRFLATMLAWAPFSTSMYIFYFCINPCAQNFVKLRCTNIHGLCSNFFACEPSLESSFTDILALCETNLEDPIGSSNFSVGSYLPLTRKDSVTHSLVLQFMWKGDFLLHVNYSVSVRILIYISDRLFLF